MSRPKSPAEITDRVLALMAERKVSGSELARRIGRTQSYVSRRLRRNNRVPWRAEDLRAVAPALGTDAAELIS